MHDPPTRPEDRLIFALDVEDEARARALVTRLRPHVGTFKVGLELLCRGGMDLAARIADGGALFIDAKLHDVPATVSRAVRRIVEHGVPVRFITVHDAVAEAVRATGGRAGILLVSVLTSVDAGRFGGPEALAAHVGERARLAQREGAAGIVCAAHELGAVRAAVGPGLARVVPGVRPAWSVVPGDDQRRVSTVGEAIAAGATHLVVGRPIRDAPDPAEAARRIVAEIAAAPAEE